LQNTLKENENLKYGYAQLTDHLKKFEDHYNKKKQKFLNSEVSLAEATKKIDNYEDKMAQFKKNIQELNDKYLFKSQEHNELMERYRALSNENCSNKKSIGYLERKLKIVQSILQTTPAVANSKMNYLPSAIKPIEGACTRESMYATSSLKENRDNSKGFSSLGRSTGAKVSLFI
jgi:chromosome segregation ATPase